MEFRTVIKPLDFKGLVSHHSKMMTLGSCFADEISSFLRRDGFNIMTNPFGTLYNPKSICETLKRIVRKEDFTQNEIICRKESGSDIFCCIGSSSLFNSEKEEVTLYNANNALGNAHYFLRDADILTITLGTARCYYLKDKDIPVANCHKFPADRFYYKRLSPEETAAEITGAISELREINPEIKIIVTVSPNRYLSYGFHESVIDKSILLLATEKICSLPGVLYFPAYEAVMDDLRDYRFYSTDMIHPSDQAVEYVYSLFSNSFFNKQTIEIAKECSRLSQMRNHRILNHGQSENHFKNLEKKERELFSRYSFLNHFFDKTKEL